MLGCKKFFGIKLKFFFLLLAVSLEAYCIQPYHQTAFIAPEGAVDLLFSYSTYSADHFRNKEGKRLPTYNKFFSHNYQAYAEYAFNNENSFTLNGGYTFGKTALNGNKFGWNELELGCKHLIWGSEDSALTIQGIAIIPCMKHKALITYGQWGAEAGLLYSRFFWDCFAWYDLGAAYRWYEGFPSDQIRANASLGINFNPTFSLIGSCFVEYGVYNGKDGNAKNHILLNPNYRLIRAQAEIRFSPLIFPYLTVTVGGFSHIFERQISLGSGFVGGLWLDF